MLPPIIRLSDVQHWYALRQDSTVVALEQPYLEISAGGRVAIKGPNGSGKTTLLHVIAGILRPSGLVEIEGINLYALQS